MPLKSELFKDNPRLRACLVNDAAHVKQGDFGEHVARIQMALFVADGLQVERGELCQKVYGPSTSRAVLSFKTKRKIINHAYQSTPDNIVGKMTVSALDEESYARQAQLQGVQRSYCGNDRKRQAGPETDAVSSPAVAFTAGSGVTAPAAVSTRDQALARRNEAMDWIRRTRVVLRTLLEFRVRVVPMVPPFIARIFDKVWANFGQPKDLPISTMGVFPAVNNLEDFLKTIDGVYEQMLTNLTNAESMFFNGDLFGPSTDAYTLCDERVPPEPPKGPGAPNGFYFQQKFARDGHLKQVEVIVHESAHFPHKEMQDNMQPVDPDYHKISGSLALLNAWSYSQFVLDVLFDLAVPFRDNQ